MKHVGVEVQTLRGLGKALLSISSHDTQVLDQCVSRKAHMLSEHFISLCTISQEQTP